MSSSVYEGSSRPRRCRADSSNATCGKLGLSSSSDARRLGVVVADLCQRVWVGQAGENVSGLISAAASGSLHGGFVSDTGLAFPSRGGPAVQFGLCILHFRERVSYGGLLGGR